jgi:hypothetical protein
MLTIWPVSLKNLNSYFKNSDVADTSFKKVAEITYDLGEDFFRDPDGTLTHQIHCQSMPSNFQRATQIMDISS